MKRRRHALVILLSFFLFTANDEAKAGPFQDFFRTLRSAIAHPKETPRPHRSMHKRKKLRQAMFRTVKLQTSRLLRHSDQPDVRWAKAASRPSDENSNLPYGTPVPGKPGLVTSPFAPDAGDVQVIGFPPVTPVEDPYKVKFSLRRKYRRIFTSAVLVCRREPQDRHLSVWNFLVIIL